MHESDNEVDDYEPHPAAVTFTFHAGKKRQPRQAVKLIAAVGMGSVGSGRRLTPCTWRR